MIFFNAFSSFKTFLLLKDSYIHVQKVRFTSAEFLALFNFHIKIGYLSSILDENQVLQDEKSVSNKGLHFEVRYLQALGLQSAGHLTALLESAIW